MSLHRLSSSRDEQVGEKTEGCSSYPSEQSSPGTPQLDGQVSGQVSGLGELAGGAGSVCMLDSVKHWEDFHSSFLATAVLGSIEWGTVCIGQSSESAI